MVNRQFLFSFSLHGIVFFFKFIRIDAYIISNLFRIGVHYIINVTSNLPNTFEDNPSFHYLRISVDDNSSHNLTQFFPEAIAFVDAAARAGDACLVHCLAGISRSVTVCLAYLMAKNKWSLEDAYDLVLRRNASIAPNFHFMGQLTEYERHLGVRGASVGVSHLYLYSNFNFICSILIIWLSDCLAMRGVGISLKGILLFLKAMLSFLFLF
ncbi:unnamed protein product [Strongylus vulgaris]|uniref:protein-tyrosine-phosphatase n=1 Tax=Strongylus vulgaris TaxID=40348 RepID=A0A3P7IT18_STRVU|nr:unnamed protein product [Strongylus vulgaris]